MKIHQNNLNINTYKSVREKDKADTVKLCVKSLRTGKISVTKKEKVCLEDVSKWLKS